MSFSIRVIQVLLADPPIAVMAEFRQPVKENQFKCQAEDDSMWEN